MLLAAGLSAFSVSAEAQSKDAKATAKSSAKSSAKKQTKAPAKGSTASNPADSRFSKSFQTKPTVERYIEIQKALHDRGYLNAPVDGKWGQDSVEALKHFQRDQSLMDDGKLGALSLVALGLGPKRATSSVAQAAAGSGQPQVE
jgi:peptidoglycan hydrolase-like protein with peptidoglycan-binding domain